MCAFSASVQAQPNNGPVSRTYQCNLLAPQMAVWQLYSSATSTWQNLTQDCAINMCLMNTTYCEHNGTCWLSGTRSPQCTCGSLYAGTTCQTMADCVAPPDAIFANILTPPSNVTAGGVLNQTMVHQCNAGYKFYSTNTTIRTYVCTYNNTPHTGIWEWNGMPLNTSQNCTILTCTHNLTFAYTNVTALSATLTANTGVCVCVQVGSTVPSFSYIFECLLHT
jgi:hypothetical protein